MILIKGGRGNLVITAAKFGNRDRITEIPKTKRSQLTQGHGNFSLFKDDFCP